jgi:hypothetical protein
VGHLIFTQARVINVFLTICIGTFPAFAHKPHTQLMF